MIHLKIILLISLEWLKILTLNIYTHTKKKIQWNVYNKYFPSDQYLKSIKNGSNNALKKNNFAFKLEEEEQERPFLALKVLLKR